MKEYNWREERKNRYSNTPHANGNNTGGYSTHPASSGGGNALKIILFLIILAGIGGAGFYYFNKKSTVLPLAPAPAAYSVNTPVASQPLPTPVASDSPAKKYVLPKITVHYKSGPTENDEYGIMDVYESGIRKRFKAPAVPDEELSNHKHKNALLQLKNNAVNTLKFFAGTFDYRSYDNKNGSYKMYYTIKECTVDQNGKKTVESVNNAYELAIPLGYGIFAIHFAFSPENIHQDAVTHEFTHAVTDYRINDGNRSSLIYAGHSGALHESFSDIFACLHHIETNPGLTREQRWSVANGSRNLANPGSKVSYAGVRYPSYYKQNDENGRWLDPSSNYDGGYVHHNMSVLCKFAYLICEGDTFRGQTIKPMGHIKTRKLFWQLQDSNYIDVAQHFDNLADKIIFAANDAKFSEDDLVNIKNACLAVNLPIDDRILQIFDSNEKQNNTGKFSASLKYAFTPKAVTENVRINSEETFRNLFKGEEIGKIFVKQSGVSANPGSNAYKYAARNVSSLPDAFGSGSSKYYQTTQCVSNIPVFASSAVVGVDQKGEVTRFSKNFSSRAKNTSITLKSFPDSLKKDVLKNQEVRNVSNYIFDPALLRMKGAPTVVWMVDTPAHRYLIDQKSGKVVYGYPLIIKD